MLIENGYGHPGIFHELHHMQHCFRIGQSVTPPEMPLLAKFSSSGKKDSEIKKMWHVYSGIPIRPGNVAVYQNSTAIRVGIWQSDC